LQDQPVGFHRALAKEHFHRRMADDLQDGFHFHAFIGQVGDSAVPKVMEDEIFNLLFLAKTLSLPICP
jgi:hypothetical protein